MKAIFLDIDGVLNNIQHITLLYEELLGEKQYVQLRRELGAMPFDYRSCKLLQDLIKHTNADIILSSTWRLNDKNIQIIEGYTGIQIKDKTPGLSCSRGIEINTYLNEHPEITNYVIIDDDTDMMAEQASHFVKCNTNTGFTQKEYEEALKILESEE